MASLSSSRNTFGVLLCWVFLLWSHGGVYAQPSLTSFTLNMTSPEQLILTFNADIDPSTCDPSTLTIQGTAAFQANSAVTFQNGTCNFPTGSSDQRSVEVVLDGWIEVQGNILIATNAGNTYISLMPSFIQGTDGSGSNAVDSNSALSVSTFTENINPPSILLAGLDFELGFVGFVFPEAINPDAVIPTGITLHFTNRTTNNPETFTLSGMSNIVVATIGTQIEVLFTPQDVNVLKFYFQPPYSVDVAAGTFTDGSGMMNPEQNGIQFGMFVLSDVGPPTLEDFTIDLNVGNLIFTFDEPMSTEILNITQIYLDGTPQNFSAGFNLSDSTLLSADNLNTVLTIAIARDVLNQIKFETDTCAVIDNCFLNVDLFTFSDISGNFINGTILNLMPSVFVPDETNVTLSAYTISLDSGLITLEFSEPVDDFSFNPQGITLLDGSKMSPQNLGNVVLSSKQDFDTIFIFQLPSSILSTLKLINRNGGILLTLDPSTAIDTSGNSIEEITSSNPLSPLSIEPDVTSPRLVRFEASSPQQMQLMLVFDEYVDPSTFDISQLSLTLVSSLLEDTTYSSFSTGTVSIALSQTVTFTFSASDFVAPFSDQYADSFSGGSFLLSASNSLVQDLVGNSLIGFSLPLFYSNVPQEALNFDLDLDMGTLRLQFAETIQTNTVLYSGIYIAGVLMSAPSGYNFNGSSFASSEANDTILTISLDENLQNQIKFDSTVCTDLTDCFIFLTADSFRKQNGDLLLSGPTRLRISNLTADTSSPEVRSFNIDLNIGQMTISFSEPVDPQSLDPLYFMFYDDTLLISATLQGAVLSGVQSLNTFISLDLRTSLNPVKVLTIDGSGLSLTVNGSAIMDISGNPANSIPISSAIEPNQFFHDVTPPSITSFVAGTPENMLIILIFDEYVLPSSWNGAQLTLSLNTLQGTTSYSGFTSGNVSSTISDRVSYRFSPSDFTSEFAQQYTEAFFNGFIGLTTRVGLIQDVGANQLQAITDPLTSNNDSVIPDLVRPTLESFDFDLNRGRLIMTFSENVTLLTVSGLATLQDGPTEPGSSYTLTQEGTHTINAEVITLTLASIDVNRIKGDPDIASIMANTYLYLNETFAEDSSGNLLNATEGGIEVTNLIEDTLSAQVINTMFDLNMGALTIVFSEPVSEMITFPQITVTGVFQNTPGDISLQDSTASSSDSSVTVLLPQMVLNQIKSDPGICTQRDNCYLFLTSSAFQDLSGNLVAAPNNSFLVTTFVPDMTPPQLISFEIDLGDGHITLSFSESVQQQSFTPSQISLVSSTGQSVPLGGGFISSSHSFDSVLVLTLSVGSIALNQAKLYAASGSIGLSLSAGAVTDTNGNAIVAIPQSNPLIASVVTSDTRRPSLLGFSPGTPDQRRLTFSFDEYVNTSTWNGNAITLTLTTPEGVFPYSSFTQGTLNPEVSDVIEYNFGGNMLMQPFTDQYLRAFERGSITLSGGSNLISDVSGNLLTGLASPLVYMNITRESVRPQINSFTFSTTNGELVMTFSENVVVLAVINVVTLQNSPNNPQVVYHLTQNGMVSINNNVVTIVLGETDLNNIRLNPSIGTSVDNTYLRLDPDFANDLNENQLLGRPAGLQASNVDNQQVDTTLQAFILDMNVGTVTLSFNNFIDVSTVRGVMLTIQNSETSNTVAYALSILSTVNEVIDSQTVTIQLHFSDINSLKATLNLASSMADSFVSFPTTFANDIFGNAVSEIATGNAQGVTTYVPDSTAPLQTNFRLDMNSGTLRMTFTEPILSNSIDPTLLTIQDSNPASLSYQLTGGSIASNALVSTSIDITMITSDVNSIKSTEGLATSDLDTFITVQSNFVMDTAQNGIQTFTSRAVSYTRDIVAPQLSYFDMDLTNNVSARITLQLSEPVPLRPSTILPAISLQNDRSSSTTTLVLSQTDTLSRIGIDRLMITLRSSYSTRILSGENIGSSSDALYLTLARDGLTDYSSNAVPEIPSSNAQRVRNIYRTCNGATSYNDVTTGTCVDCPSVCVSGCNGGTPIAGTSGCDMCYTVLLNRNGTQNRCIEQSSSCPLGYFDNTANSALSSLAQIVCEPCNEECATCTSSSPNDCQGCNSAFMTSQPNGPIVQCLSSCSVSANPSLCGTCHPQCNGCTGTTNTNCIQCREDSMAVDGSNSVRCVPRCDENQFLSEDSPGEYTCQSCHQDCIGCTGPTQGECLACRTVYVIQQGVRICRLSCPGNMFPAASGECTDCNVQCIGCNGTTNMDCISCAGTSTVSGGRTACVTACEPGQIFDMSTGECILDQTTVIVAAVVGVVVLLLIVVVVIVVIITCVIYYRRSGIFTPGARNKESVLFIDARLTEESTIPITTSPL